MKPVKLRTYKAFTQDQALQAARADFGASVNVVQSRVVKRKGLSGFWHRRIIEVTVEIPEAEIASSGGIQAAAVAWTCQQLGVPFVALKGITDLVDGAHATRGEFESNLATAAASLQAKLAALLNLLEGEPLNHWGE